jgi:predicted metal-dependent phosphoesterase TrpH
MSDAFCDLHAHSTASDGSDAPEALPSLAKEAGLAAFALTDHDTTAGLAACAEAAEEQHIAFVPGIELSADPASLLPATQQTSIEPTAALHILGYFVRRDDPTLNALETRLRQARARRNPEMVQRLRELGVDMTHQEVLDLAAGEGSQAPGRPHIGRILVNKGYVKSIHEAFSRYIGEGGAAYVRKARLTAREAIEAIHTAGGLASLAHPVQLKLEPESLEHVLSRLRETGLDAIETRHSDHGPAEIEQYRRLSERFRLAETGGSDYHGRRKDIPLGSEHVPLGVYQHLHQLWQRRAGGSR